MPRLTLSLTSGLLVYLIGILFGSQAIYADQTNTNWSQAKPIPKIPSTTILEQAARHNRLEMLGTSSPLPSDQPTPGFNFRIDSVDFTVIRPFAEYENTKYLIMHSNFDFSSQTIKETILQNLPDNVTAIIYVSNSYYLQQVRNYYSSLANVDKQRLKIVLWSSDAGGFWSRDAIPLPVYIQGASGVDVGLVDAKYYHAYEPDQKVSEYFDKVLIKHNYYFEGGNFLADAKGKCFVINSYQTTTIPDLIFQNKYGCKSIIRFPSITGKGIGHIDERIKILSDDLAITDSTTYKSILEEQGFRVVMLPMLNSRYETYLNSLLINDTIFVPIFNKDSDARAISIYESLGYKTIALNSSKLSNEGLGSIHCITMTYPEVNL